MLVLATIRYSKKATNLSKISNVDLSYVVMQCTEVCFASFLSDGFTIMAGTNPPERKLHLCAVCNGTIYGGDFVQFCVLLRIYES